MQQLEVNSIDEALAVVGGFRRWHILAFFLVGFSMFMPICWQTLIIVFVGWEPVHKCRTHSVNTTTNGSVEGLIALDSCKLFNQETNETIPCRYGWEYENEGYYTITEHWNLVCGSNYLSELSQTFFQLGFLLAVLFVSPAIDKIGRKPVFILTHFLIALFGTSLAFATNYTAFVIVRTILGAFIISNVNSGTTYLLEIYDTKIRAKAGVGVEYLWVLCFMALPLMAYLVTDWRTLQIIISAVSGVWILLVFVLPESPQWLAAVGRKKDAEDVLKKMARWNGVDLPEDGIRLVPVKEAESKITTETNAIQDRLTSVVGKLQLKENVKCETNNENENVELNQKSTAEFQMTNDNNDTDFFKNNNHFPNAFSGKKIPLLKLLTDANLRTTIIICNLLWFANCLLYYGLIFSTPTLAGNRFVNFILMGFVEVPASLIALYAAERYGRRLSTCLFHILAGVPLAFVIFIPAITANGTNLTPLIVTIVVIAKFGISCSFSIVIIYTREVFPTGIRSTGSGMGQISAGIGNMVAPLCAYANKTPYFWLPNILFGVVSVAVGLLTLLLPETAGRSMPQDLEDLHKMFHDRKFICNKNTKNSNER